MNEPTPMSTRRWPTVGIMVGVVLLIAGFAECYRAAADSRSEMHYFFNGDTLFPEGLYRDCVLDGDDWSCFRFPMAPFWFPDIGLYFVCRVVTGAVSPAIILYAVTQFLLLLLAMRCLIHAVIPDRHRVLGDVVLLAAGAIFLAVNAQNLFQVQYLVSPFLVQLHVGALICTVYGLAFTIRILTASQVNTRLVTRMVVLFVIVALTAASDRIIAMWFTAPVAASLAVVGGLAWRRGRYRQVMIHNALPMLIITIATLAGIWIHQALIPPEHIPIDGYTDFSIKRVIPGLKHVAHQWSGYLLAGDLAATSLVGFMAASLVAIGSWLRRSGESVHHVDAGGFVALSYGLISMTSIGAVVSAGLDSHFVDYSKFLLPVYLIPIFGWGLWLILLVSPRRKRWPSMAVGVGCLALATIALIGSAIQPRHTDRAVLDYYPTETRLLDELAEQYGWQVGLGRHWEAQLHHLMSRRGVVVLPVVNVEDRSDPFAAQHHLNSYRRWFNRENRIRSNFAFFIIPDPTKAPNIEIPGVRKRLLAHYGQPRLILPLGQAAVWIYDRPSDREFREMMVADMGLISLTATGTPGETLTYPGRGLPGEAVDKCEGTQLVAYGPYLPTRPGRYQITLKYSSSSEGWWETQLIDQADEENTRQGALPPGEHRSVSTKVVVPKGSQGHKISARVFAVQAGTLTLHQIEITRLTEADIRVSPREPYQPIDHRVVNAMATGLPAETLHYPASGLLGGETIDGTDRQATPETTPPGCIVYGPYLSLSPGRYQLRLRYSATEPAGFWETQLIATTPGAQERNTVQGTLEPGNQMIAMAEYTITSDQPKQVVTIRVNYSGQGELTVHDLEIERLK